MADNGTIKCRMWNARGLETRHCKKLEERVILTLFQEYDILGILESHTSLRDDLYKEGFVTFHNPRHQEPGKEGMKNFGGVVVYVRQGLAQAVSQIKPDTTSSIWLLVDDAATNIGTPLAIGMIYVPPGADQIEDPMQAVREGLALVPHNSMVIMMGDFNAKIGHQLDEQVTHDDGYHHVADLLDNAEEGPDTLLRRLADGSRNMYGRELERVAVQERLVCLNGTHIEGAVGNYTCFTKVDSPSVLDLGWCSDFIHDFMPDLSDHAPLGMTVQCDGLSRPEAGDRAKKEPTPKGKSNHSVEILKANWTDTEKRQFLLCMGGETNRTDGRKIIQKVEATTTQKEMDAVNEELNDLIRRGMKETCNVRFVRKPTRRHHIRDNNKPWFTQKCGILKKRLRKWGTTLSKTKHKPTPAFYGLKKEYKNEKKRAEKDYKNAIHMRMATAKNRNPRMWWELLRKLNGTVDRPRLPPIELNVWADHFKTLLNDHKSTTIGCTVGTYHSAERDLSEAMITQLNVIFVQCFYLTYNLTLNYEKWVKYNLIKSKRYFSRSLIQCLFAFYVIIS